MRVCGLRAALRTHTHTHTHTLTKTDALSETNESINLYQPNMLAFKLNKEQIIFQFLERAWERERQTDRQRERQTEREVGEGGEGERESEKEKETGDRHNSVLKWL